MPDDKGGFIDFVFDSKNLMLLNKAFARLPQETAAAAARVLHDKAWSFQAKAAELIAGKYKIRNKKFVTGCRKKGGVGHKAWEIDTPWKTKAEASSAPYSGPLEGLRAMAYSRRIEEAKEGLFTGWEEELTGKTREMRSKGGNRHKRTVTKNARKGESFEGLADGRFRFRSGGGGYDSDKIPDSRLFGMPASRFVGMMLKSGGAADKKKGKAKKLYIKEKGYAPGKNKIFILEGGRYKLGLYAIVDGKVKMMQAFDGPSRKAQKFDWRSLALADLNRKFTQEYVFKRYVKKALKKAMEKK